MTEPHPIDPDTLAAVGRALYGEKFLSPLAELVGLSGDRHLRYWLSGTEQPNRPKEVRALLQTELRTRAAEMLRLANEI